MKFNVGKTKVMNLNNIENTKVMAKEEKIQQVGKYRYLTADWKMKSK